MILGQSLSQSKFEVKSPNISYSKTARIGKGQSSELLRLRLLVRLPKSFDCFGQFCATAEAFKEGKKDVEPLAKTRTMAHSIIKIDGKLLRL